MTLRPDLVLVKLAPASEARTPSGLITAPAMDPAVCYGKVVQIGARVLDVAVGDIVTFGPTVGDPLDGMFPTPHLLISFTDIDAVLEPQSV